MNAAVLFSTFISSYSESRCAEFIIEPVLYFSCKCNSQLTIKINAKEKKNSSIGFFINVVFPICTMIADC